MLPKELCERIAAEYDHLPHLSISRESLYSYVALCLETEKTFKYILQDGISVEKFAEDPYKNSKSMFEDIDRNRRLRVFTGGDPHPIMSPEMTFKFRACHDYHGHFMARSPFSARGEQVAWARQQRFYNLESWPALATELVGQSCWFNYGPYRELPPSQRSFPPQKAALLPQKTLEELFAITKEYKP